MVVIDGQGFSNNLTVDVGCEGVCTNYIAADIVCPFPSFLFFRFGERADEGEETGMSRWHLSRRVHL